MVSVRKPWLICGYHGLTIVIIIVLFVVKPRLIWSHFILRSILAINYDFCLNKLLIFCLLIVHICNGSVKVHQNMFLIQFLLKLI